MKRLTAEGGWLGSPAGPRFDVDDGSGNPFVRYRRLLWAYRRFAESGRSDGDFVAAVERLDRRVAEIGGRGFRVTPSAPAPELSKRLGVDLWVKDETGNVTGTHKARHLMGLALHLEADAEAPQRRLAIASCGNAALAAATVARAADRPLDVFIPPWADAYIVAALEALGADIEVCPRRPGELGDPCFSRFREATAAGSLPFCSVAVENLWTIDGGRTLAFEMIESLAGARDLDALFVQVGGGALASSVVQGFVEAADAGVVGRLPALYAVQAEGCAPLQHAWNRLASLGAESGMETALDAAAADPYRFMQPWAPPEGDSPQSIATGILDDITYDWLPIVWGVAATGGDVVVAPEDLVAEAHALARRWTDVPVDPTGTAGLAGLLAARRAGLVAEGARVGVLFTGVDRGT
ncbi:MAG: pyridoxal-phosphate dependent enzyme [Acidimicrobiia bacterium]|nr:pyridoxal-phosphate dependent enzyme [Acidimicrobiia bacterium]MYC45001.1 pyridoxal-phosphate dependent enzyme [Acidimicrobiia bacterium]